MYFQFLTTRRIDRFMAHQNNTAFYYKKMAHITTEEDLKKVFVALSKHHSNSREKFENVMYPDQQLAKSALRKGKSYLGKLWREVTIALLVNNRKKLTEFARQSEVKLLQEIPALKKHYAKNNDLLTLIMNYEKSLENYIEKIGRLPLIKAHQPKSAA